MIPRRAFFYKWLVAIFPVVWTLITACTFFIPTDVSQVPPTCIPSSSAANPYTSHDIIQGVQDIYNKSQNPALLGNARQDALYQLGQNMEHWSAQVDIANDNNHMVRITVTYLDPSLIQYLELNYYINDPNYSNNTLNSPLNINSFEFQVSNTLQSLSTRNEMLFIVTITSPFYSKQDLNNTNLIVRLPIGLMTLSSASNMQVQPTHFDRILSEGMNITQGPVSGIVGYPLASLGGRDQCNLIIDQWTNTLTLDIPSITLGGTIYQQKFWSIPFRSLVLQSDIHPTPTNDIYYLSTPSNTIYKLEDPPTPGWTPYPAFDELNAQIYWENMGRYIWNLVITQSHQ